ncbi:CTP synthase N-terminus-domain-containing protein [Xylaria bambusicola]|uniref:CTP synthase N-terminus-domain-containing protein n=1 Tax=Xylaria bambusicola TaxID=326684 RepID=UPI0020084EC1|nr:CTP synthase N-terminus-domain-containing protein [Xylaria bambusicola]KAI0525363.1 CTP synthase N-terminus-domain-containing protein [Xylaria bambusicola]
MHYILVAGGVISGVGKGIIASSTGLLLQTLGYRVSCIKVQPLGLMAPAEHGECFVLSSGGEVDLDLGNYERYLSVTLSGDNNITLGKMHKRVHDLERKGHYLGKTVQIVPHLTDCIQEWIERVAKIPVDGSGEEPDICIIELGGTVGDMESAPFLYALTKLRHEVGSKNFSTIMVSYVATVHGEQKTKPTQHCVKAIRSEGLIPDVIACRCEKPLEESTISKISLHCQVGLDQVVVVRDMPTIYQVPHLLHEQGLVPLLLSKMDLPSPCKSLAAKGAAKWESWMNLTLPKSQADLKIALVGKYVRNLDAYMSVVKAVLSTCYCSMAVTPWTTGKINLRLTRHDVRLEHAAMHYRYNLKLLLINAEDLEPEAESQDPDTYRSAWDSLASASGLIIPGGFGKRGVLGMMLASRWAREQKRPYLGICLGFQVAVMQFARDMLSMKEADSEEFRPDSREPIIIHMPEVDRERMGATMRLGLHDTVFQPGSEASKIRALYGGSNRAHERHRHRYEVNPQYVEKLQSMGLHFVGKDTTGQRMEIFELQDHPFFIGTQFHAEYQSRVLSGSPPYLGFIAASAGCLDQALKEQTAKGPE